MLYLKAVTRLCVVSVVVAWAALGRAAETPSSNAAGALVETDRLAASIDPATGTLSALKNKLTGETYAIADEYFGFETADGKIALPGAKLTAIDVQPGQWTAKYRQADTDVEAVYVWPRPLCGETALGHVRSADRLAAAEVSRPAFATGQLELMSYGYPKFETQAGRRTLPHVFRPHGQRRTVHRHRNAVCRRGIGRFAGQIGLRA